MKIAIIGAGVMGTAVGQHLANNGARVNLWGTKWDKKAIDQMKNTGRHEGLDINISENIHFYYEEELEEAVDGADIIVLAVLSSGLESTTKNLAPFIKKNQYVLSVTKGIDGEKLSTMSTIVYKALPENLREDISIIKLGGPLIAKELAQGRYSEAILASKDKEAVELAKKAFKSESFRVNISDDTEGVDLCAALKNVYAIGMGIADALEPPVSNLKAAWMAKSAMEMGKIVEFAGGNMETALGPAGVGDLYVTSLSGRNGRFGAYLGQGLNVEEALDAMEGLIVEGYDGAYNGYLLLKDFELNRGLNIEEDLPLFNEIYQILYKEKSVEVAIKSYWG